MDRTVYTVAEEFLLNRSRGSSYRGTTVAEGGDDLPGLPFRRAQGTGEVLAVLHEVGVVGINVWDVIACRCTDSDEPHGEWCVAVENIQILQASHRFSAVGKCNAARFMEGELPRAKAKDTLVIVGRSLVRRHVDINLVPEPLQILLQPVDCGRHAADLRKVRVRKKTYPHDASPRW